MKSVSQILGSEKNTILKLIINWTEIAGVSNRELMIPAEIKDGILMIAVPNGMVAKTFARFKYQLLSNLGRVIKNINVSDIKFIIDPSRFKEKTDRTENQGSPVVELSEQEILEKKKEIESKGITPSMAESMAKIELLWQKKKKNAV